jgi:hypothetical protein
MDQETLVKAFRKVASQLEKAYGPVALLLLVAPDEETFDEWNVLASAHRLDPKPVGEAVRLLTEILRESLPKSLWPLVARATVLRTNDPFIQAFTARYPALPSGATVDKVRVSGVDLAKAVVVETNRRAA